MSKRKFNDRTPPDDARELVAFVEELKRQWLITIDAIVDPLMLVDKDYRIIRANLAMSEFTGLGFDELIGAKCHQAFAGEATPCQGCRLFEAAESHKSCVFDLKNVREGYHFEVTSQPIDDPQGEITGVVQIYRDRTDAKAIEAQLVQSEKLASIGLLAGGIAHEINNPLGGILIFAQMLLKEMPKDSSHYKDIQEIEAACQRCKSIVDRLLNFARARPSDALIQEPETVDINDAMRNALKFARVHINAKRVKIDEKFCEHPLMIRSDRNNLIQVFLNLMHNSLQAMDKGGYLSIQSEKAKIHGQWFAVCEVKDTGNGIPPQNLNRIFDPFFTTKQPGEGTGLGLSICYGIIKELGGHFEVNSTVGKGTSMKVFVPIIETGI